MANALDVTRTGTAPDQVVGQSTHPSIPLSSDSVWRGRIGFAWTVAAVWVSFVYLDVRVLELLGDLPAFFAFFFDNFLPPNYANIARYVPFIIDTVLFAVVGTYISALLSFVFGLLMSRRYSPVPALRWVFMVVTSVIRNVPFLVWASLLIFIFGIGNLVGLLAISLVTIGFLARSYAVSLDEIESDRLDGLRAAGASYGQILIHGLIPEFIPAWLNWTLFTFEINIRASAVLGMVGAGGMGIMIQTTLRHFRYREALSLIIVLVVLVLLTETVTNQLRSRIR